MVTQYMHIMKDRITAINKNAREIVKALCTAIQQIKW